MIKLAKEIDTETLASIIRQGILKGSITLYGHQYLQVIVIPFEVVPYDVFESDFVSYALQTLQHTGNFGIAVKILDMAFVVVVVVPSNRLDIVKC